MLLRFKPGFFFPFILSNVDPVSRRNALGSVRNLCESLKCESKAFKFGPNFTRCLVEIYKMRFKELCVCVCVTTDRGNICSPRS